MPFTLAEIRVLLLTHTFHDVLWGGTALSFPPTVASLAQHIYKQGQDDGVPVLDIEAALTARLLAMTLARSEGRLAAAEWASRHAPIDPANPDLPSWITCAISEATKRQGDRTLYTAMLEILDEYLEHLAP